MLAMLRNPEPLTAEDWRYVGAAALGAVGLVAFAVGWRARRSLPSNPCEIDVYVATLGRAGVSAEVAERAWTFAPLVEEAALHFGVPGALLMGLIHTESKFSPSAGSSAGAVGLTQYIPSSAVARFRILHENGQWPFEQVAANNDPQAAGYFADQGVAQWLDRTDPAQSIWLGAAGLRAMFDKGYDIPTALAVYNAGPSVAGKPSAQWPAQTRAYVPAVLERAQLHEEVRRAC